MSPFHDVILMSESHVAKISSGVPYNIDIFCVWQCHLSIRFWQLWTILINTAFILKCKWFQIACPNSNRNCGKIPNENCLKKLCEDSEIQNLMNLCSINLITWKTIIFKMPWQPVYNSVISTTDFDMEYHVETIQKPVCDWVCFLNGLDTSIGPITPGHREIEVIQPCWKVCCLQNGAFLIFHCLEPLGGVSI